MKSRQDRAKIAFTITETIIASIILVIAIIGTGAYRYQAAMSAHKTDLYTTGVRTTLLLCEGWAGADGDSTFNPVTTFSPQLNISTSATGTSAPTGYTKLGYYKIIVEGVSYFATLSWKNLSTGGVRSLHVMVKWDLCDRGINTYATANQSYHLTTYVKK
jgi:hypothetical protein